MNEKIEYVLDSTALLALVSLEPGYQRVAELLEKSAISAVNLAETSTSLFNEALRRDVREVLWLIGACRSKTGRKISHIAVRNLPSSINRTGSRSAIGPASP